MTPQKPTLHAKHDDFESEVIAFLVSTGWIIPPQPTYHEYMPEDIRKTLASMYDLSSQYIRTRADRIAIHPERRVCVEWEAKTTPKPNFACEALPLFHHIHKAELGARCIYVVRHGDGLEYGFPVHRETVPKFKFISIPSGCDRNGTADQYLSTFRRVMPDENYRCGATACGSGDPFVVSDRSEVEGLPHWKDVFNSLVSQLPNTSNLRRSA